MFFKIKFLYIFKKNPVFYALIHNNHVEHKQLREKRQLLEPSLLILEDSHLTDPDFCKQIAIHTLKILKIKSHDYYYNRLGSYRALTIIN